MGESRTSIKSQLTAVLENTWSDEPPEEVERIQVTVRLDREDVEFISAIAGVLEVGRAEVIRRLVKEGLEGLGEFRREVCLG